MGDGGVAKSFPFILRFCEASSDILTKRSCLLQVAEQETPASERGSRALGSACWQRTNCCSFARVPTNGAALHTARQHYACRSQTPALASLYVAASSPPILQMIGSIIAFSVIVEYRGSSEYNYIVSLQGEREQEGAAWDGHLHHRRAPSLQ